MEIITPKPDPCKTPDGRNPFFVALGYDRQRYFFRNLTTGHLVILDLSRRRWVHGAEVLRFSIKYLKAALLVLAPAHFWQWHYPGRRGVDTWTLAFDGLLRQAERAGLYTYSVAPSPESRP